MTDREEYMRMLFELMRRHHITIMEFIEFGIYDVGNMAGYSCEQKKQLATKMADAIKKMEFE